MIMPASNTSGESPPIAATQFNSGCILWRTSTRQLHRKLWSYKVLMFAKEETSNVIASCFKCKKVIFKSSLFHQIDLILLGLFESAVVLFNMSLNLLFGLAKINL